MPVDFNNLVNDPGDNSSGTLIDAAEFKALLMGAVATASTVTGAQNNWAPGLAGHTFARWAGASDATFSGLAGGVTGQIVMVRNTGTKNAFFLHQSGLSSPGNKFTNAVTSSSTPVAPGGWIMYRYDGTDWQLVGHEQGAWITPTYVGGNFTGSGSMTWTVDSGDVVTSRYRLNGKTISYGYTLNTVTIGGTPSTVLQISNGQWGGYTIAATSTQTVGYANDGSVIPSYIQANASGTSLGINKNSAAAWTAVTNAGYFQGVAIFEVT